MSVILPVSPQFEGLILHTRYTLFQYLLQSLLCHQDIESNHTRKDEENYSTSQNSKYRWGE